MAVFDWAESEGSQLSQEPRVTRIAFGDGYAQRAPSGINNAPQTWSLSFRGVGMTEGDQIIAFFRLHGGWQAFDWTPPRETVPGRYTCARWTRSLPDVFGMSDITAEFKQEFEPV